MTVKTKKPAAKKKKPLRHRLYGAIQIAAQDAGLIRNGDDTAFREMLKAQTGETSRTKCSEQQLTQVLLHLRGEKPAARKPIDPTQGRPAVLDNPDDPLYGHMTKVEAFLAEAKLPWNYAHGIGRRMYATERLEWLGRDELVGVITALRRNAKRKGLRQ